MKATVSATRVLPIRQEPTLRLAHYVSEAAAVHELIQQEQDHG